MSVVCRDRHSHCYRVFSLFVPDRFSTLLIRLLREYAARFFVKLERLGRPAASFIFQSFLFKGFRF